MDSQSKIPITTAQVERIVAGHFGPGVRLTSFEELKDGFFNTAACLELSDGRKMVLKAAPPDDVTVMRYEKNIMRAEVGSMRLVHQCTSVPAPEVLVYDTSKTLLPSEFFIMEFLPGVSFHKLRGDLPAESVRDIEAQMGRMCRQIGEVTGPSFGLWDSPEPAGTSWRDCFDHMLQGVLLDAQDMRVDLEQSYDEIYAIFAKNFDVMDEVRVPHLVHWDMWAGNVLVDPNTCQVTGLIDFERALWGDPLTELFFLNISPDNGYMAGLGENMLATPNQVRRRTVYDAYLFLIMIVECYFRHYPTNDQENWSRSSIKELLKKLA